MCGTLVATTPAPEPIAEGYYAYRYLEHARKIKEALNRSRIDLVHMHGCDFHEFIPEVDVPVLATLHLPPSWYPQSIYSLERPRLYLNCVSASQRMAAPDSRKRGTYPEAATIPRMRSYRPLNSGSRFCMKDITPSTAIERGTRALG